MSEEESLDARFAAVFSAMNRFEQGQATRADIYLLKPIYPGLKSSTGMDFDEAERRAIARGEPDPPEMAANRQRHAEDMERVRCWYAARGRLSEWEGAGRE